MLCLLASVCKFVRFENMIKRFAPLLVLLILLGYRPAIAQDKAVPEVVAKAVTAIKADSLKADYLNNYLKRNFIDLEIISPESALAIANWSEKLALKLKDKKRQYLANLNLYKVHEKIGNQVRANRYKNKAGRLNVELGDLNRAEIENQKAELEKKNQQIVTQQQELASSENTIQQLDENLQELDKEKRMQEKKLSEAEKQLYLEKLERENKEAQLRDVEQQNQINVLELQRKSVLTKMYALAGTLLIIVLAAVIYLYVQKKTSGEKLKAQNLLLAKEKRRSDELLLNILPGDVAEELKAKGKSKARSYDSVSVMFTDFKDFTKVSEQLSPEDLVREIDYCFKNFDAIIGKYGLEKIKTIGDAYLCAAGLPNPDPDHAKWIIKAALEIRNFMREVKVERQKMGLQSFDIRIGINSGPVVAGIVGVKKFAYDIWGDTVNTASRMESSGEAGKVNVSGATYERVKDQFYFIYRGKIPAKNKGEVDMYFVEANES